MKSPKCPRCSASLTACPEGLKADKDARSPVRIAFLSCNGCEARCSCGTLKPSTLDGSLAFFEYCGEGSPAATDYCICGFHKAAHDPAITRTYVKGNQQTVVETGQCKGFSAQGPRQFDKFYCGCRGWD